MELTDFMTQGLIVHLSDTGVSDPLNIPRGWFIVEAEIPIVQDFPPFPLTPPPPLFFSNLAARHCFRPTCFGGKHSTSGFCEKWHEGNRV